VGVDGSANALTARASAVGDEVELREHDLEQPTDIADVPHSTGDLRSCDHHISNRRSCWRAIPRVAAGRLVGAVHHPSNCRLGSFRWLLYSEEWVICGR